MERKKISRVVVEIACIAIIIIIIIQNVIYSNLYNLSDEKILSEHQNVHHTILYSSSILNNQDLEASMFLFCGNGDICYLTAPQETTINLSCNRYWGKGKLLLENQGSGEIRDLSLNTEKTEAIIKEGTYQVFLVGKWFGGKFTLKSDDILFKVE